MDATTGTCGQRLPYTTSKQVQAWFLLRSRDKWKAKCKGLRIIVKRHKQRADDVSESRAKWRSAAEAAQQEVQRLQDQVAALRAQIDALSKKN
jgi:chromosome segregation ATPase